MAISLNILLKSLYTGASWSWMENLSDYPAPAFSLEYYLKLGTSAPVIIHGITTENGSQFSMTPSETSQLASGEYNYQLAAKNDTDLIIVASGVIEVKPLLSSPGYDPRGYWTKLCEKLRSAYLKAAERGWAELEIDGETIRYTRETLLNELKFAEYKAKSEKNQQQGIGYPRIHKARFI